MWGRAKRKLPLHPFIRQEAKYYTQNHMPAGQKRRSYQGSNLGYWKSKNVKDTSKSSVIATTLYNRQFASRWLADKLRKGVDQEEKGVCQDLDEDCPKRSTPATSPIVSARDTPELDTVSKGFGLRR